MEPIKKVPKTGKPDFPEKIEKNGFETPFVKVRIYKETVDKNEKISIIVNVKMRERDSLLLLEKTAFTKS